ncbi:helix-turn-helix domain-containing protein [Lolliginicoccus suaedae]|uniref:helix-turn-helix domain-containing protein n=1 Tax=Lolliginicoccus suaedae TaxID=2605429 RepID=UPI001658D3D4|nr:helix-turn-helix transcriptional regulator [Lolliginicoccus suaedae]
MPNTATDAPMAASSAGGTSQEPASHQASARVAGPVTREKVALARRAARSSVAEGRVPVAVMIDVFMVPPSREQGAWSIPCEGMAGRVRLPDNQGMAAAGIAGPSEFGARIRQWRAHRGLSQLALAGRTATTSRHVSFLETGRSRPSQEMVLRIADALDVPLRERNALLRAAGLPPRYPEVALQGEDLAPFRAALDRLLAAHLPYPAMVLDAHWNVLLANEACARLYGPDVLGSNVIRRYTGTPGAAEAIVNWAEVAWAGVDRLRQQRDRMPFDAEIAALLGEAEAATRGLPRPAGAPPGLVACPWFRVGDRVVRTIGMVSRFEATAEVTLDELRIELTYPLDAEAEAFFRAE